MGTSQFTKRRDAVGVANDVAHSQWRTTNWIPLGLSQSAVLSTGQLRDALSGADVRLRDGQHVDTCCVGRPAKLSLTAGRRRRSLSLATDNPLYG